MTFNPAYAQASTLVCALLSLLFGWMRWRHRDPGAQWFAAGFLLIAAIFAFGLRVSPEVEGAHRGASLLGALGIIGLGFGLIEYVGPTLTNPRRWRWLIAAPLLLALAWLPFGQMPRVLAHGLIAISLTTMSVMAWTASRQEKGAGLMLIAGPLGGVATLTRLAIDAIGRGDIGRALTMLDAVAGQADSLGKLVTDLLTLARVGDATLSVRPVDLSQCMQEATEQLRLSGQAVDAVKSDSLGSVQADAGLLRQVFVNLIGNALKFSHGAAQPQVRVELLREPNRLVVAVRDNGAGFAPERAKELFEPFRRLHGAAFEGTGLGLTIVRRIVERHGGSVWAEGRPGQGASFYVSLHAAHAD